MLKNYLMNFAGWLHRGGQISLVLGHDMGCVGGGRSMCDLSYVLGLAKHQRVQRFDYS